MPSSTVPSASTRTAVGLGSVQPAPVCDAACVSFIAGLNLCRRYKTHMGRLGSWARAAACAKGIAMLRDDINSALKDAMKAKDERAVSTLRMVNATLKNADIE